MHSLISDKLVGLVEKNVPTIIERWTERILADPTTSTFSKEHLDYIIYKARSLLSNLGKWLHYDTTKEEIRERYEEEGIDLFNMGIPLSEVFLSLVVLKRILWLFIVNESAFDSAFELHQMREFNDRVVLFFDRADYYIIRVYMEEMNRKMKELYNLTDDDTEKIFFRDSFYNKLST